MLQAHKVPLDALKKLRFRKENVRTLKTRRLKLNVNKSKNLSSVFEFSQRTNMETLTLLYIIFGMCACFRSDKCLILSVFAFFITGVVGTACLVLLAVFGYCYVKRGPGKRMTKKSKIGGGGQKTGKQSMKQTSAKSNNTAIATTPTAAADKEGKTKKAKSNASKSASSKLAEFVDAGSVVDTPPSCRLRTVSNSFSFFAAAHRNQNSRQRG